jgi:membrane-bound metal-dependent hydrolase YbcI (DUF457 family)
MSTKEIFISVFLGFLQGYFLIPVFIYTLTAFFENFYQKSFAKKSTLIKNTTFFLLICLLPFVYFGITYFWAKSSLVSGEEYKALIRLWGIALIVGMLSLGLLSTLGVTLQRKKK